MKIITGKKRVMRDELVAQGTPKDTGEIRQTFDLTTLRSNLSYMPPNETQTRHKHFLVNEAVHVLSGQIDARTSNNWKNVKREQVVLFDLGELHNIRTRDAVKLEEQSRVTKNVSAVTVVYKWIPPYLKIYKDEASFVIENDWFEDRHEKNFNDLTTSPVLRLKKTLQEKFWEIIKRNDIAV
jgi:uncharacterized cupin superfamily protein